MVMAEGKDDAEGSKTRQAYMYMLAGEVLTKRPSEGTTLSGKKIETAAMRRGREMEPLAIEQYENTTFGAKIERVGFVRRKLPNGRFIGCSPDGLLNKRKKAIEVKTLAPHRMIDRLERGGSMPPEHHWQVMGTMLVAGVAEVDLILFYSGMPVSPRFTMSNEGEGMRKELQRLSDELERFDHELHKLVERTRNRGIR
jgi:hypothetical protein